MECGPGPGILNSIRSKPGLEFDSFTAHLKLPTLPSSKVLVTT